MSQSIGEQTLIVKFHLQREQLEESVEAEDISLQRPFKRFPWGSSSSAKRVVLKSTASLIHSDICYHQPGRPSPETQPLGLDRRLYFINFQPHIELERPCLRILSVMGESVRESTPTRHTRKSLEDTLGAGALLNAISTCGCPPRHIRRDEVYCLHGFKPLLAVLQSFNLRMTTPVPE